MKTILLLFFTCLALNIYATNPVSAIAVEQSVEAEITITETATFAQKGFVKKFFHKISTKIQKTIKWVKAELLEDISDSKLLTYSLISLGIGIVFFILSGPVAYFLSYIGYIFWLLGVVGIVLYLLRVLA